MAKTSTGRTAPAKVKAPPKDAAGKAKSTAPVKKVAAVKMPAKNTAPKKAAAPKMAPAATKKSSKTASAPVKRTAAMGKGTTAGKAPAKKSATAKTALPRAAAAPKKSAPAKKAAASKTITKTVAVKKAAPRRAATRVAVPTPAPRRARPSAAARKAPPLKPVAAGPQVFTVSHLNEADFKADGLRTYAQYRDLGIAAATAGLCQAHVIRLIPPCTEEVRKRHRHQADLQLVYVLKGWMKNEFEGHGEQMMSVGSCWLQPSGIKHTVLDYSADCEVLEIIVPADFKTEETP